MVRLQYTLENKGGSWVEDTYGKSDIPVIDGIIEVDKASSAYTELLGRGFVEIQETEEETKSEKKRPTIKRGTLLETK